MQTQARSTERRSSIIRDCTTHSQAIPTDRLRFTILSTFQCPLQRSNASTPFLEFLFGVAIRLKDRFRRFFEVVKLAELVGHSWKDGLNGCSDRLLTIGDDARDRDRESLLDVAQQRNKLSLSRAQERAGKQHFTRKAIADQPEHLVTTVWLQAIKGEDDAALCGEEGPQALLSSQLERDELFVALDHLGDRPLSEANAASEQLLVDLTNTAILSEAEHADKGNHIQTEFSMRQGPGTFLLGAIGMMIA
jgi:hypothetical protein